MNVYLSENLKEFFSVYNSVNHTGYTHPNRKNRMFYIIDKFQLIDSGWPRCSLFEPQKRKQPLHDLLPDTVKERRANEAVPRYRLFLGFHWSVDGNVIRARPPRERDNSDPSPRKYVISLLKIHRIIYIYFKIGENWRYKEMSLNLV